jgi:tripartite-type tricarboxylate transporter receptor subunit TctC
MKTSLRQTAKPQCPSQPRRNNRPSPKIPSSGEHPRRRFLRLAAGAATLPAVSRVATAQTYPSRPITMIVPVAAGGASDAVARILAERMRQSLGRPIIVENVVGAAGTIGLRRAARAPSDGYTIGMGNWGTHVALGATYQLDFDLLDFAPVAQLPGQPGMIATRKTVPVSNLRELIAWLKANQDKVSVGTSGIGGESHVWGISFQNAIGVRLQFVPYRGAGPATNDLVAGHIDLMINVSSNFVPHLRGGAIKAFATLSKNRLAAAPDVPTVDEAGLPGFYLSDWTALWAPKDTPKNVIAALNAAAVDAMADPGVRARMATLGLDIPPREQQTPEALGALQKAEIEKWWPIIKAAGIKVE